VRVAASALALAVGIACAGCATPNPATYTLTAPVTIHVLSDVEVWQAWEANGGETGSPTNPVHPYGFCRLDRREIWVRWGSEKGLPDFECLGHELYHLVVGDFHPKQTAAIGL
jgi:hypothetical protein